MDLYSCLLDFISFLKKIELAIVQQYSLKEITVFRAVVTGEVPRRGEVKRGETIISFYFHGSGGSYYLDDIKISYDFFRNAALGIRFNLYDFKNFMSYKYSGHEFSESEFNDLVSIGVIAKVWTDSDNYYLKNNFD